MLDDPSGEIGVWNPEKLLEQIDNAYHIANGGRLNDRRDAQLTEPTLVDGNPYVEFAISEGREGYWMEYELPINGNWAGVHVRFEFYRVAERYAATLRSVFAYGERRDH